MEQRPKVEVPHDPKNDNPDQSIHFPRLIGNSKLVDAEHFSEVVVKELTLKPNKQGKFDVFWDCQNPRSRDMIAIYIGDPIAKKQRAFLTWVWVDSRQSSNVSTDAIFANSDEEYYAVYCAQENDKYALIKSVPVSVGKHEALLSDENKTLILNWTKPDSVGYWDYIALYDFKPRLGPEDAKRNLFWQWQWAVNATSGSFKTGTQDNGTTIYYVAYCTYGNKGYCIENIAGVVTGYTMKNVNYEEVDTLLKYKPVRANLATLNNPSEEDATLTSLVSFTNTCTKTWSTTHAWKIGLKVQFDAKIPIVGIGGKWELSTEVSGSYTSGDSTSTTDTFSGTVAVKVKPKTQVDIHSMLLLAPSPEFKYTADLGVIYRGESTESAKKIIDGTFTTNSAQKIEITVGNVTKSKEEGLVARLHVDKDPVPVIPDHRYTFFYHSENGETKRWPVQPELIEEVPFEKQIAMSQGVPQQEEIDVDESASASRIGNRK